MNLSHYTGRPITLDRERTYEQHEPRHSHQKPVGFWVSVDGEFGWKEWCTGEDWNTDGLDSRLALHLAPTANVLHLETVHAIIEFTHKYGVDGPYTGAAPSIDWPRLAGEYDGIIVSPYQWECRYEDLTSWYYGWDCASGCIWNLDALITVDEMEGAMDS